MLRRHICGVDTLNRLIIFCLVLQTNMKVMVALTANCFIFILYFISGIIKICTTCFPSGTLANVERLGKSRKRQVFCAEGFPGAPWWFQDPGGPMVGIAGGIVANIPSLGHTKSPAECPSVARIFVRMMVRWDKQTLWVVPPPP